MRSALPTSPPFIQHPLSTGVLRVWIAQNAPHLDTGLSSRGFFTTQMALPRFAHLVWIKMHLNRAPRVVDVTGAAATTPFGRTLACLAYGGSNFHAFTLNLDRFSGQAICRKRRITKFTLAEALGDTASRTG